MDVKLDSSVDVIKKENIEAFFTPFSPSSVVLFSSTTQSGKTFFLIDILRNRNNFFIGIKENPVTEVLVVLFNELVNGDPYLQVQEDNFKVEVVYQDEFVPEEHLKENQIVIFDDVQYLTPDIKKTVKVYAHHIGLKCLFIVVQAAITEHSFRDLLKLGHALVINFNGSAATNLSKYLTKNFLAGSERKAKFNKIVNYSEAFQTVLLYELNEIVTSKEEDSTKFQSINNLANLKNMSKRKPRSPVIVSPKPSKIKEFEEKFGGNEVDIDEDDSDIDPDQLPAVVDDDDDDYVLVKVKKVKKTQLKGKSKLSKKEQKWNNFNQNLLEDISFLKWAQQPKAKAILKAMLSIKEFGFTADTREVFIKGKEKLTSRPLLDFLSTATRMAGPNERPDKIFVLYTKLLRAKKTPLMFFKNKSLLKSSSHSSQQPSRFYTLDT